MKQRIKESKNILSFFISSPTYLPRGNVLLQQFYQPHQQSKTVYRSYLWTSVYCHLLLTRTVDQELRPTRGLASHRMRLYRQICFEYHVILYHITILLYSAIVYNIIQCCIRCFSLFVYMSDIVITNWYTNRHNTL